MTVFKKVAAVAALSTAVSAFPASRARQPFVGDPFDLFGSSTRSGQAASDIPDEVAIPVDGEVLVFQGATHEGGLWTGETADGRASISMACEPFPSCAYTIRSGSSVYSGHPAAGRGRSGGRSVGSSQVRQISPEECVASRAPTPYSFTSAPTPSTYPPTNAHTSAPTSDWRALARVRDGRVFVESNSTAGSFGDIGHLKLAAEEATAGRGRRRDERCVQAEIMKLINSSSIGDGAPSGRERVGARAFRPDWVGDGFCDYGEYNTQTNNFDGGDCCPGTCRDSKYSCGANGFRECKAEVIDLVVGYTVQALAEQGGNIAPLIKLAVQETNMGFRLSGVPTRVRAVSHLQVDLPGAEQMGLELTLDIITSRKLLHPELDRMGADIGVLLTGRSDMSGMAHLGVTNTDRDQTVVAQNCASGSYSFGHELGRMANALYDPATSGHGGTNKGFIPSHKSWRTIMSYGGACHGCERINRWSGPEGNWKGEQLFDGRSNSEYNNQGEWLKNSATLARLRSPVAQYSDMGLGKCRVVGNVKDVECVYIPGVGVGTQCEDACTADTGCFGFSHSQFGNCLLWTEGPLQGGGDDWGLAHCMVKNYK